MKELDEHINISLISITNVKASNQIKVSKLKPNTKLIMKKGIKMLSKERSNP